MSTDRTLLSRYEFKYYVDRNIVPEIRMMTRPFLRVDPYSRRSPGLRYTISSLYLDAPGLPLYASTVRGLRNRYKLRIRSYADDPASPVFCEVKRRADQVIRKIRTRADRGAVEQILSRGFDHPLEGGVAPDLQDFVRRCRELDAQPFLHVRYEREAYESSGADPVRLTFDTNLNFLPFDAASPFRVGGDGWAAKSLEGTIVEIKFTGHCPAWVARLVSRLQMMRESIPKYVLSVEEARDTMPGALGLTVPEIRDSAIRMPGFMDTGARHA